MARSTAALRGRRSFLLSCTAMAASAALAAVPAVRLEPGDRLPRLAFRTATGSRGHLPDLQGARGLVLVTWDKECPVSQRYQARVRDLAARFASRGYAFAVIDVTPHSAEAAVETAREFPGMPVLLDSRHELAVQIAAESTAEAFVFGSAGLLEYRGAIDDQYGINFQRRAATHRWLEVALEVLQRSGRPPDRRTRARGCPLSGFCTPAPPRGTSSESGPAARTATTTEGSRNVRPLF